MWVGQEVVKTSSGDFICTAGPGAVDVAFLYKAAHRKVGRLVLGHADRLRRKLAGIGAEQVCASSNSDDGNNSDEGDDGSAALIRLFAAHAADGGARA